jgi:hypothetical protein
VRYVIATVVALFVIGWATGAMPVQAMAVIAIIVILAAASFTGGRSRRGPGGLQRTVFYNDSMIGYKEQINEQIRKGEHPTDL